MNVTCGKCGVDVVQGKDTLKCSDCGLVFHTNCTSSKKVGARKTWKCDECSAESSSTTSKAGAEQGQAVLDAIAAFRSETLGRLDQMQLDIKNVTAELVELKSQIEVVKEENSRTSAEVETLKSENSLLSEELRRVRGQVNDLQQHTRKNNLIISGVPWSPREDIYSILADVSQALGVATCRVDISAAHRLPQTGGQGKPSAIVVNFVSRSLKADWMAAKKAKKRLSAKEINSSFPNQEVYLNEHLTVESRVVFNRGRELVKEGKLAFVWVRDGRILAKKSPTGRTIRVRELADLEKLDTVTVAEPRQPPHTTPSQQYNTRANK